MKLYITHVTDDEVRKFDFWLQTIFQVPESLPDDAVDRTVHRFCDCDHHYALTVHRKKGGKSFATRPSGDGWRRCKEVLPEDARDSFALWQRPIDAQRDEREKLAALQTSGGAL